jgi:hypothetical protein
MAATPFSPDGLLVFLSLMLSAFLCHCVSDAARASICLMRHAIFRLSFQAFEKDMVFAAFRRFCFIFVEF